MLSATVEALRRAGLDPCAAAHRASRKPRLEVALEVAGAVEEEPGARARNGRPVFVPGTTARAARAAEARRREPALFAGLAEFVRAAAATAARRPTA